MSKPTIMAPAQGSRIVRDGTSTILFGQPPEVLKGLLRHHVESFDTLVLTDVKEKDGSVLNNLEFPFYFFLFVSSLIVGVLSDGSIVHDHRATVLN